MANNWDLETDLVVVGSGAAGMTSALTGSSAGLDTLVVEKADVFGGTTALSGGVIWVPTNSLMASANIAYLSQAQRRQPGCRGQAGKPG
jgi:3-oxosteroid 1-dehydrogenase